MNAGGEMAVPKKRHLFEQGRRPIEHSVEPPSAKIDNLVAFHHPDLADLALEILTAILGGFDLHPLGSNIARMRPGRGRDIGGVAFYLH